MASHCALQYLPDFTEQLQDGCAHFLESVVAIFPPQVKKGRGGMKLKFPADKVKPRCECERSQDVSNCLSEESLIHFGN